MPSPFPGMNPWMEAPELWPGVHAAFISEIRSHLNTVMPPRYFADVDERVILCDVDDPMIRLIVPDVTVREAHVPGTSDSGSAAVATITPALRAHVADTQLKERRIVIRLTEGQSVVTAIEILSPANKLKGSASRTSYLSKRRDLLQSEAHFIEVDLLRAGNRTEPTTGMDQADYLIWLSRSQNRTTVDYWPTALESPLPTIPVPLLPDDSDVVLNLQTVLHDVHDRNGYVRRLDYSQPVPSPPLTDKQVAWLKELKPNRVS
ncbi:MAG: DUF4058 family protein [Planctomycetaceae bacterium]|nr:DUF4058 family protein [Planctomycetaceae bacterium]